MSYNSYGYSYDDDDDQYSYVGEKNYQTPYGGNYDDIVPFQALGDDSAYGFHDQSLFEYDPTPYYGAYYYDPPMNGSLVSYSVSSFCQPKKAIVYDPYSDGYYSQDVTQFRVSYSVQEFNEPEFEEYDPTPYGGGYDLALTYGEPLPQSEATCYPRSSPESSDPVALIPKINVDEPAPPKPHIETKPTPNIEDKQQLEASNGDDKRGKEYENIPGSPPEKPLLGPIEAENYSGEGNGDDYEMRVPQIPSGYGLEAVDLCESLFGYWPCLDRYKRNGCRQVASETSNCSNQWKDTADYLFGSSYPYGYGERIRDGINSHGDPTYDYQRHYQEQSLHRQVEYDDEDSWMHKFKIF